MPWTISLPTSVLIAQTVFHLEHRHTNRHSYLDFWSQFPFSALTLLKRQKCTSSQQKLAPNPLMVLFWDPNVVVPHIQNFKPKTKYIKICILFTQIKQNAYEYVKNVVLRTEYIKIHVGLFLLISYIPKNYGPSPTRSNSRIKRSDKQTITA